MCDECFLSDERQASQLLIVQPTIWQRHVQENQTGVESYQEAEDSDDYDNLKSIKTPYLKQFYYFPANSPENWNKAYVCIQTRENWLLEHGERN